MPKIEEMFIPHTARSAAFDDYLPGNVAFVTNGLRENGVIGFVKPMTKDKVFKFMGIVLSAFCEATVQIPPFIARGNGGSGLIVLEPRNPMSASQLIYIAAWINAEIKWRFSWSRQASVSRIQRLSIPEPPDDSGKSGVRNLLPQRFSTTPVEWSKESASFKLDDLYNMESGDYHNASILPSGPIPLISCGDADNGIVRHVSVPDNHTYSNRLTIAFNGMNTLTAKYHPYVFATKDDVAICSPKSPMRISTEIFIQTMLNRERWRYSYYRKCYMEKLKRFRISLPTLAGKIDEDMIQAFMETSAYWPFLNATFVEARKLHKYEDTTSVIPGEADIERIVTVMYDPDTIKEPSAEYQNFENALRHALTVPKEELDRRIQADKQERGRKKAEHSDTK